jgi:hypothetical protein
VPRIIFPPSSRQPIQKEDVDMPRTSEIDEIASAVAYRLSRDRETSSASLSRSAVSRISSAVAYTLAGGRGRGTSVSGRGTESRIASAVAFRLRTTRRQSPIVARLAAPRDAAAAVSRRSVRRPASLIADRLASQPELRQRARVSIDAVASAITRRLRYSDQLGTFPISAVASRVARLLYRRQPAPDRVSSRRQADALASTIVARLTRREGSLPIHREGDPGRQPG